jgi:ATP adenylyltransferase
MAGGCWVIGMAKARTKKSVHKVKAKRPKAQSHAGLLEIWPQERDYMARPERFKYVRQLVKPTDCVFCEALAKGAKSETLVLAKNRLAMVMLNKYPYNNGHLLVLPARHCGNLLDLSDEEYFSCHELLRMAAKALVQAYDCPGFNIGLNHGKVAGAGLPNHLHWHIVPRWTGDTNFFPLIAETKVVIETLDQSYVRLKKYFSEWNDE